MSAMMKTIKDHVRGDITILLADAAHNAEASLACNGCKKTALEDARLLAEKHKERYRDQFAGCQVVFWHDFICKNESYESHLDYIKDLYRDDPHFKECLLSDAKLPDNAIIQDLFGQCACLLVLANQGYRYLFYPGRPCSCTEYLNSLLAKHQRLSWISVFLSIERKTYARNGTSLFKGRC